MLVLQQILTNSDQAAISIARIGRMIVVGGIIRINVREAGQSATLTTDVLTVLDGITVF